ncbi:MAG TPA: type II toxin-antitoxin system HicB family antitoxin [Blastocatellia bacterium]
MLYKIPLVLDPQPEGGFTVTSPLLPELVTEGDTLDEALSNARDALAAVIELYEDLGRPLPSNLLLADSNSPVWVETVVAAP